MLGYLFILKIKEYINMEHWVIVLNCNLVHKFLNAYYQIINSYIKDRHNYDYITHINLPPMFLFISYQSHRTYILLLIQCSVFMSLWLVNIFYLIFIRYFTYFMIIFSFFCTYFIAGVRNYLILKCASLF